MSEGGGLNLARAVVSITGDNAPLKSALTGARQATDRDVKAMQARLRRLGATFSKVGRSMTRYVRLPIVAAFGLSVRAFGQQEDAVNALSAALANAGEDAAAAVPKFKRFAAAMQQQTIYGDELILSQMAYAKNLGVTTDQLEDAAKAAIGLAAKYKIDLQTAMMLVGRASKGQTQMLTRYGIVMDESLSAQEKFNRLLVIGAGAFGLAEAEAKTMTGQLGQMKNAVSDAAEGIGEVLAPTVKRLAAEIKEAAKQFTALSDESKTAAVEVAGFAAVAGPLVIAAGALTVIASKMFVVAGASAGLAAGTISLALFAKAAALAGVAIGGLVLGDWLGDVLGIQKALGEVVLQLDWIGIYGRRTAREQIKNTQDETKELRKEAQVRRDIRAAVTGISEAERLRLLNQGPLAKAEAERTKEKEKQVALNKQLSVVGIRGLWAAGLGGIADAAEAEKKAVVAGGAPQPPEKAQPIDPGNMLSGILATFARPFSGEHGIVDTVKQAVAPAAPQAPAKPRPIEPLSALGGLLAAFTRPASEERGAVATAKTPLAAADTARKPVAAPDTVKRAVQPPPPQLGGSLGGGVLDVFTRPFSGERGTVGAAENPLAADTVTRVLDRIATTLADIRQQGLGQPEPAPVPIP